MNAVAERQTGGKLSVALLALPEATASTIYGLLDFFASAGRDWDFLMSGVPGRSKIEPWVAAAEAKPFPAANGVWIHPNRGLKGDVLPEVVCIPDIFITPDEDIGGRYEAEIAWLRRCHEAGAVLAGACSGALLLAEAGLLNGQDATTHWGYCAALGRRYPLVKMHPTRVLVTSGPGQRLITAGGGTSWQDLGLYLVARYFGPEEAMRLAKLYLMDWHRHGQLPFAALARARQVEDARIAACQEWIADNYAQASPVAGMAAISGLSERSFKRHFAKATGMTPLDYVHTLRLEEAKQMLERTELSLEAVANEVGYEDTSFFRRLFRRKAGMAPGEYRKRFGSFRKVLATAQLQAA